jgi:hypothetical protein
VDRLSVAQWLLVAAFIVFAVSSVYLIIQSLVSRRVPDLAVAKGRPAGAVFYSLVGAMMPWKKESARLHLPVYALGVGYHIGTFASFFWLVVLFFHLRLPHLAASVSAGFLGLTAAAGLALLLRRAASANLRYFSCPDDYFSNALVTGFQVLTAATLLHAGLSPGLFIYASVLLIYLPLGKLRHAIYFASARYHLGVFYGRRGVWNEKGGGAWRS